MENRPVTDPNDIRIMKKELSHHDSLKEGYEVESLGSECVHEDIDTGEVDKSKDAAQRKLIIIMIICLSYMTVEIIFGLIAKSLAILTDAADLFSDSIGFIINISAIYYSSK